MEKTFTTRAPKATDKPEDWSLKTTIEFPDELKELVDFFGGFEVLRDLACAQYTVKYQGAVRTLAEAGKTDEEIVETMSSWKVGDSLGLPKDPIERVRSILAGMSPEVRATLLADMHAKLNG